MRAHAQGRVEAPADPSRLLRGTAAHMRRVAEVADAERSARDSAFILHPHVRKSVPAWRAAPPPGGAA